MTTEAFTDDVDRFSDLYLRVLDDADVLNGLVLLSGGDVVDGSTAADKDSRGKGQ